MTATSTQADLRRERDQQVRQAEELLGTLPEQSGFAKGLFRGQFIADWIFPYPQPTKDQQAQVATAITEVAELCDKHLDADLIDREADIPTELIEGLGRIGVLGMTAPQDIGGKGMSQVGYGQVVEEIASRCSSTAIFVNVHHSVGMRSLLLYGTDEQKTRFLPDLVRGTKIAAFALTEPEAGSDASNVQTTATPSDDGSHYILNGEKRYITNGAISDVITVMARTPISGSRESAITAFLVTPGMPGFQITEARMEKLGLRGTVTSKLAFDNMRVPRENIVGEEGKGLKVALTLLNFGRTTFGACCTGAARTCLRLSTSYATERKQFQRSLADFELVQQKIARMSAWTYAMEAMTTVTAGLIDRAMEDYMLETAMLKVWTTERLWTIVNDAFQIHGGAAYFTDRPLERLLRDHRLNQIAEGANEVLISFIALTGMRGPGMQLKDIHDGLRRPWNNVGQTGRFAADWAMSWMRSTDVPVRSFALQPLARRLGKVVTRLGRIVRSTLIRHREEVLERQLEQERIAWAAMELFASACVLSRCDQETSAGNTAHSNAARWFVTDSLSRAEWSLKQLNSPIDRLLLDTAQDALNQ